MAQANCTADGCTRIVLARGLCRNHYEKFRRSPDWATYQRPACSVDGCDAVAVGHGYCSKHHQKWRKYGDPLGRRTVTAGCTVDGCERPHSGHGLCDTHLQRQRKHGDPLVEYKRPRVGCVTPDGYIILGWKGHPLANANDAVFEHRVVLWDAIGPGVHPCHWCGRPVDWAKTYPKYRDALIVDHLDHDPGNNDLANLVPSCNPCNTSRDRRRR